MVNYFADGVCSDVSEPMMNGFPVIKKVSSKPVIQSRGVCLQERLQTSEIDELIEANLRISKPGFQTILMLCPYVHNADVRIGNC